MQIPNFYEGNLYRRLLLVPLLLIFVAVLLVPRVPLGIDFKGGLLFTVYTDSPASELVKQKADLESRLSAFSKDASVRSFENPSGRGFEIELQGDENLAGAQDRLASLKQLDADLSREQLYLDALESNASATTPQELEAQRSKVAGMDSKAVADANSILAEIGSTRRVTDGSKAFSEASDGLQEASSGYREKVLAEIRAAVPVKAYTSKEIGASLSKFFFSKVVQVLALSFFVSAVVIVLVFRSAVPTVSVLFGAFADIMITLGVMGALQIPLSLASVAALLMLIGFSLDTDMLLTIRALKRQEGTVRERIFDSMKTGFTMNTSAILAFTVLIVISIVLNVEVYFEIGTVVVIGSIADFIATWLGNAPMVLWYADAKGIK
ncbi:MAG: hypothetical protein V1787_01380 [Candidatus Micrarchaeota archaeon]